MKPYPLAFSRRKAIYERTIERAALGDVVGATLDKGVELDAAAKEERVPLFETPSLSPGREL